MEHIVSTPFQEASLYVEGPLKFLFCGSLKAHERYVMLCEYTEKDVVQGPLLSVCDGL